MNTIPRYGCVILLVLGFSWAGCARPRVSLRTGTRSFTDADYETLYKKWTRDADEFAYGRLQDVLNVTATFESWEFRWAYVVRYAHDFGLSTETRTQTLHATLNDSQQHHRFFVTLAGPNYRESDLTSDRSAWRVVMVDPRARTTVPLAIDKILQPGASERTYFPSVSRQRWTYRIVFPTRHPSGRPTIGAEDKFMLLRFTGALGTVDLRWDFES